MESKIADTQEVVKEFGFKLEAELNKMKDTLKMDDKLIRKLTKKAKWKASKMRKKMHKKNWRKLLNLRQKKNLKNMKKAGERKLSPDLAKYQDLEIMGILSKEEETHKKIEKPNTNYVLSIDVDLNDDELGILSLPPKTCVNPTLNSVDF